MQQYQANEGEAADKEVVDNRADLEGQPERGNQPKLLKGIHSASGEKKKTVVRSKKIDAYGRFEDEIDASRVD